MLASNSPSAAPSKEFGMTANESAHERKIEPRTIEPIKIKPKKTGRERSSESSSKAREKFRSSKSQRLTGSKRQITTHACTSGPGAIFYGGVLRNWKRIWIPASFAACIDRAS